MVHYNIVNFNYQNLIIVKYLFSCLEKPEPFKDVLNTLSPVPGPSYRIIRKTSHIRPQFKEEEELENM